MELPVRISRATTNERVVSVDGAWNAPGLNLSHWPGHKTPRELQHDLSTGVALNFARLSPARRAELADGCVAIVNNHYDTDGTCALFAVRHPEAALQRERALLDAAAAGDFFERPNEDALRVDWIVAGLADPVRSPLAADWSAATTDEQRHQHATDHLLERLPEILAGDFEPYRTLWEDEMSLARADQAELALAVRDDVAHLDWTTWVARRRAGAPFTPGRHALFGASSQDRILVASPCNSGGAHYRFLISTRSWFDLPNRERAPRPDLAELAARLNRLEGVSSDAELAWRAQPADSPSPEVWFGGREPAFFAERATALAPSTLEVAVVRRAVSEVLREALALPQ